MGVQDAVAQEPVLVAGGRVAARGAGVGLAPDVVAGSVERGDDGSEVAARFGCGDGGPVAGEAVAVEAVGAGTDGDGVGGDAQEEPGGGGLAVTFPGPQVEVVLVRVLSLLKRVSRLIRKIEPSTSGSATMPGTISSSAGAMASTNAFAGPT